MRNVIRNQLPTLDAGLTRLGAWWQGRPPRERTLLAVLALLLGGVLLVYAIVKPIQDARAAALADIRSYEVLAARIRAAGPLGAARPPRRAGPPAVQASQSAAAMGLGITTAPLPGGVRATVADASYDTIVTWLADVTRSSDLRVQRVTLQRLGAPGHVSAVVELVQ